MEVQKKNRVCPGGGEMLQSAAGLSCTPVLHSRVKFFLTAWQISLFQQVAGQLSYSRFRPYCSHACMDESQVAIPGIPAHHRGATTTTCRMDWL